MLRSSLIEEQDVKAKVRKLFKKLASSGEGLPSKETEIIPKSITFTKTALPILYSNLILIEDMKFENSNYFLGSNGFVSKKIALSSLKHDPSFNISNCVFRIFPRTYNVNKYKVLDLINQKGEVSVHDINFKFSAEIFNNLDIIQNKFGEPVRYGDIIMLMHEKTQMFIQYVNSTKSLTFSNHDGDATLFSFEPATEIMLNDNKILKSGQPIRLKVAGFNYANQNLFFGLSTPYSMNKREEEEEDEDKQGNEEEEENEENEIREYSSENVISKDENSKEKFNYDKKNKKYLEKPDLVVEENSPMNWRFVLYNPFTTNEELINFGDYVRIMYCDQNKVVGAICEEKEEIDKNVIENRKIGYKQKRRESFDLKENILVPDDEEILIDDINENDLQFKTEYKNPQFYLSSQIPYNKSSTEDVNSTWILENVYPDMKMQSFIRFYEEEKLDSYRMTFRLRHFKTNKILSIAEVKKDDDDNPMPRDSQGIMKGEGANSDKMYKFVLIDDITEKPFDEKKLHSIEYQFSLFGFKKTNKSKSVDSTKPAINDFLKLYHVSTQRYIKIIPGNSKKRSSLNFDGKNVCYLTLIKYPDEKEVVKIERIHYNTQWKFTFVKNLYNLMNYIIQNFKHDLGEVIDRNLYSIKNDTDFPSIKNNSNIDIIGEEEIELSNFVKLKFVLDKLFKFVMNKFVNKYNDNCGFSNVVNNRQLLLSHFNFSYLFLIKFIYFYWMHDNNLRRIRKVEEILFNIITNKEVNNYLNSLEPKDKALYQIFRYTESIFQFMIMYCKDNSYIKKELYNYLHVFFIFMNLSEACIDSMIEIFKNESSNSNFLIRDCIEKKPFQNTLLLLFNEYFYLPRERKEKLKNENNDSIMFNEIKNKEPITLFDLILEYIKISIYSTDEEYAKKQIMENRSNCDVKSFNTREKYFELLISLLSKNDTENIQDNQIYLIKKVINIFATKYILNPTLSGSESYYPPCLVNFLYELAKNNKKTDDNPQIKNLYNFIETNPNFTEENLEKFFDVNHLDNSISYFICNSKIYTYLRENQSINEEIKGRVSKFFDFQKATFIPLIQNKKKNTWLINFLESKKVELACSMIKFMKNLLNLGLLNPHKEKDFLYFLISFFKLNQIMFSSSKSSNIIQGDMVIKEKNILERIIKTEHEKYISISETWHKIYQIFKRVLISELEENFYIEEKKKYDFLHLKSNKKGEPYNVTRELKKEMAEKDDNNMNNIVSQNKLIENDEIKILKDYKQNNIIEKENFIDNDKYEEGNKDEKNENNLFNRLDGESKNYIMITREDLKKENRIKLIKDIVSVFKLLINKNINYLKKNFIKYYSKNAIEGNEFIFEEFIQECIPNLEDGNENINRLIRRFCEPKIDNTFDENEYINLNNFFDSSNFDDLNFIQNLIIAFSTSDDEEIQEIILGLLYMYFHQRNTLFKDIILFNEQLIPEKRKNVILKYNKDGEDIKVVFVQFFKNYELNKNKYDDEKPNKVELFLNTLIDDSLYLYENIFNYWKAEISLQEKSEYDQQKIEHMINKLRIMKQTEGSNCTTEIYLDNITQISYFLYFIRNNRENQYISSLVSILKENGDQFYNMFFLLLTDLINKGKKLLTYLKKDDYIFFQKPAPKSFEEASVALKTSIKNKYFICVILLLLSCYVVLPKDDKTLNFLTDLFEEQKDLIKNDSYTRNLLLLLISDIQSLYFSVDYFYICRKSFETLDSLNFGVLVEKDDNKLAYPVCFSILFLDIIYNILSFIIYKNKMINETYLDEIIADTFLYLLRGMRVIEGYDFNNKNINNNPEEKEKIKLIIKLIKTINLMSNIEQLNRVIMLKIDPMNSNNFNNEISNLYYDNKKGNSDNIPIDKFYPQPHNLYQLFLNNLHELYNDTGNKLTEDRSLRYVQNIYEIYKYFLYFITFIDPNYFINIKDDDPNSKQKKEIKNFILYVLYGYIYETDKFEVKSVDMNFMDDQSDEIKQLLKRITFSSLHLLFNQTTVVKYFDFCQKDINGIKIDRNLVKKNFSKIFVDFKAKLENFKDLGNIENIEKNFDLYTKIEYKTTDNSSVNIYILNQIDEIFVYSLIMDVAINIKSKKEDKEEELELLDSKIKSKTTIQFKEEKFFNDDDLRYMLEKIKTLISLYENQYKKSQMVLFQNMLNKHKKDLHVYARKENSSIIYYILSFIDGKNKSQTEQIFTHFIQKSVDFINNTLNLNKEISPKRIKYISYLIYIIKKILSFYEKNEADLVSSDFRKKTLREMQMIIEKTGLIKICLQFIKLYNNEKLLPFINNIFKMFCKMLKFGETNKSIATRGGSNGQKLFYDLFQKKEFETVFQFMTETINKKIQTIISNKFLIVRNKKLTLSLQNQLLLDEYGGEIDESILEFLQLLCENHNLKMQKYLHKQKDFRKDYDLVTDTQHYLNILFNNFEPFLFKSLCRCFDLLIEMVQGPCFESQLILINSKLLVTINDLLKYYLISETDKLREQFPHVKIFSKGEYEDMKNNSKDKEQEDYFKESTSFKKNFSKMTTKQISLLTYKATILLQALVDSRNKFDSLYGSMMNIIDEETLKNLYIKVYFEHLTLISKTNEIDDYIIRLDDFNRAGKIDEEIEDEFDTKQEKIKKSSAPEEYLILETGFYAYFLTRYYQDYNSTINKKEEKEQNTISKFESFKQFLKNIFFIYEFFHFIYQFIFALLKTICLCVGLIIKFATFGKVEKFNILRLIFNKKNYRDEDAKKFYEEITASIEVLKDENVFIIYFFKLPFCNGLNKFEKQLFLENIDRSNPQSKLMDIMKYSDKVKYELETDYKLKEFAAKIPILGVIYSNIEFWKDLSLLISLCLNILNFIASHYEQTAQTLCIDDGLCIEIKKWNEIQTLGMLNEKEYDTLTRSLSLTQCIIGCLIYLEYMMRKAPSIYKLNKELAEELNYIGNKKTLYILYKTILEIITSFSIIYYTGVVVFGFLGIYKSNFFFSFLLLEIITRFKTLQNVLVAIKNPYKELILIFILWIILIYYFSIIGYLWLRENHFPHPDKDCNSLLKCVATIFHQNNRMDNGISGYLKPRNDKPRKNPFTLRFFYDEIGNLMLKILIGNMISGIIIDNFAALRKSETEMIYDMNNICTICSLKKDKISKIYKNYGKDYNTHQNVDHFVFNYIFYIIYLYKKEKTELNGMESYIYESAFVQKDITWFPNKKLYIAKPEELEIESDDDSDD